MRDAQRTPKQAYPYSAGSGRCGTEVLDESTVLEHLELDLAGTEDRNRIIGICNGLVLGAAMWLAVIFAVTLVF